MHSKFVVFSVSLFNNRLTEIEVQGLRREIEKVEIDPQRVDTLSEMSYGESSGIETVRE